MECTNQHLKDSTMLEEMADKVIRKIMSIADSAEEFSTIFHWSTEILIETSLDYEAWCVELDKSKERKLKDLED